MGVPQMVDYRMPILRQAQDDTVVAQMTPLLARHPDAGGDAVD